MAIAVLDLDFNNLPAKIENRKHHNNALVLIRIDGRPVGQALITLPTGQVSENYLREALLINADSSFWENWLYNYLELPEKFPPKLERPTATIAICTRDRPEDLQRCLESLMLLPDDGQEILVVDNCPSTDATRLLVKKYPQVRYIHEPRPGLDIARNRALREANHEIVAFTDDDAAPDPNWLRTLLRNYEDPQVMCVTGLTMPIELETEAQIWFQHLGGLGRGFKRRIYDNTNHDPLLGWVAGAGVNMSIRRSLVTKTGLFDEALDVGTPTRGGGDTEIYSRILAAGYRIVYDPQALNWHRHRPGWKQLRRQLSGYESAGFAIWTRQLLFEGRLEVLILAWEWLWREFFTLGQSILRIPGSTPLDLVLARFWGALCGPWLYIYSVWRSRKMKVGT